MSFGERFLHHPERFPAAGDGESWGEGALDLDLPGGPYRFHGVAAAQEAIVRDRFGDLCRLPRGTVPATPAVSTALFRLPAGDFRRFDLRGWEYTLDAEHAPAAVRLAGLELAARLDWGPELGGALWTPDGGGARFAGLFENYLRVLVAYRLLDQGGVVLHSGGVARALPGGPAFLFLGRSGAGKTTASRLSQERGAVVLSDDLNALCTGPDGDVRVAKLPFTGDLGDRRAAIPPLPLAGLFRLEKAAVDELLPLGRAEALACLLACSPSVNVDPYRRERLETSLLGLLERLPAPSLGTLRFTLGGGFWSILDEK